MGTPVSHKQIKTAYSASKHLLRVTLVKDGADVGSIEIAPKEAVTIAGVLLGAAREAHRASGKPQPSDKEADVIAVIPSGLNVGPGRRPNENLLAVFYFGEAALGIELPNSFAQLLAQRLMTSAAGGLPQ
jgi:hypothetical protein